MSIFVGRAGELQTLADVVASAGSGPAAAIVMGEPGSGKSRLLIEARRRARVPHSVEVMGYELERHVSLAAAAELLRRLTRVPEHGPRLEALLLHAGETPALDPVRIFEAAHRSFCCLEPVLLVIDDLQWMDELSFALCHYLIRAARESGQRIAVLAATRPSEKGGQLVELLPTERVSSIELAPLTMEEGVELARAIDPRLDTALVRELWTRAQGSPFWLDALVRTEGAVGRLSDFLMVRMHGATPDASALLALLGVAGRPIDVAWAASILDWPAGRVDSALAELISLGIAVGASGAARPAHDLIREAALGELSAEARQGLHRRLAERLESAAADDLRPLREALEHRRAAGLPNGDLASRLAGSPQRTLLGTDGLRLLASIADESDPLDPDTVTLQGEVAGLATELAEHEEALSRWLLVAERADSPVTRATALLAASKSAYALGRVAEARAFLADSQRIDVHADVLELEQDAHEVAILLWLEWRTADGRALVRDAVSAAERLAAERGGVEELEPRERRAYLDVLRLNYEAAVQEGDTGGLLRAAEAREAAARGFEIEAHLEASLAMGAALFQNGRAHEAAVRFRSLWAETHRRILPGLTVDAGYWLARTLSVVGDLIEAQAIIREVADLAARAGDVPRARHRVARVECGIALLRGRPREALRRLEHETAVEPNEHQRIAFHQDLAAWCARLDATAATARVGEHLDAGRACSDSVGCPRCAGELLLVSAEALARIGERDKAHGALAQVDRPSDELLEGIWWRHADALAEETADARVAKLKAAVTAAERSGFVVESLWIQLDLGRALADTGSDDAVATLEHAASVARERGVGTVRELAEQTLRSLGVRTWRRGLAGTPLTPREQEVSQLVAAGATNREIAKTLFLSPKTIERHVSNALKKLGARNRAELASRLRELDAQHAGNAR